jgi:hypothetical protein
MMAQPVRQQHRPISWLRLGLVLLAFALYAGALPVAYFGDERIAAVFQTGLPAPIARFAGMACVLLSVCAAAAPVARLPRSRPALTLAIALASPVAFKLLTSSAAFPALTVFLHIAWLIVAALVGLLCRGAGPRSLIARTVLVVTAASLLGSAALVTPIWLDGYAQATQPLRLADAYAGERILLLNMPVALRMPVVPVLPDLNAARVLPAVLPDTVTVVRLVGGAHSAPDGINGFATHYDESMRTMTAEEASALMLVQDRIVLGATHEGRYTARWVGGVVRNPATAGATSRMPLAVFRRGTSQVILHRAQACRAASNALQIELEIEASGPELSTAKFFRHALRDAAQVAVNDAALFGGLLELRYAADKRVIDVGEIQPAPGMARGVTAARIGMYDWQNGARWQALQPDGTPYPDNAVQLPVTGPCALARPRA